MFSNNDTRFWQIADFAPCAMLLVDEAGKIILANQAAELLFGYSVSNLVDCTIDKLVPDRFRDQHQAHVGDFFRKFRSRAMGEDLDIYALKKDGSEVPVEIGLNSIETPDGRYVICAIINISDRRQAEKEKDDLISQLKIALDEVRTLRGLIPICASCKKVRDLRGYWQKIEQYLKENTEAVLSHGLCPDCAVKLYPDYMSEDDFETNDAT